MATLEQKRRPSVTILDPIIPSRERERSSNPSSPATRNIPLPPPSPLIKSRDKDGSIILPSAPTHEPEDSFMSQDGAISRDRVPSPFGSATTSTSSLSLPPSPTTLLDNHPLSNVNNNHQSIVTGGDEEEELEELADEDDNAIRQTNGTSAVDGASLLLPQSLQHNPPSSRVNQSQAELRLNLLAVQLAALKALHSLLSNFLSSINHESSSSREVNQESTSTSTAASPSLSTPPKELLVSLLDAVEQFSKDLLPDKSTQTGRHSQQQSSESSLQSPIESERDSLNHQAKQEVSLARLNNLLENLSSINLPNSSQPLASTSDIQLSSTLGALVKSLDRVRNETNKHLVKTTGDSEESEGEESGSGSGGSFSAPGSAGLSEGLDPTSPLSPQSLVDSPGTGGSPSLPQRSNDHHQQHSGSTPQASTSTSSLPLTTTSHESLSRQRRGSFPTTNTAMINNYQTNFIEDQLRDPFAETLDTHQQHQEPDVFSTLHKLMANLSGRTLPATLGTEKEKAFQQQQATELGSSTDSQLVPASPSLSEPFGDHKKISSPDPNASTSLDSISQASHLLAITRELVAARRAIHSSTSRSSYGYGFSSSSLRSRSAGASSASLASQNPSISGGMMNAGSQSQEGELQSTRGDLSNMGRLSRTSSGSGRSERGGETSTTGTLQRKSDSPSLSGAILGGQSPSIANNLRGSLPPRYEDEDGGVESRSVDTHGSLRSSLIGSQSTTLPAYAGLGIASSEKGEKNEKEKDRYSVSSSTRSPNASSTAIQTPPSILRNPLPSGSNIASTSSGEKEWERARSPSGRSEYAARTSADLSLVQSSIERLYNAVPQLADQRVAPPARLTSVINKNNSLASTSTGSQQVSQSPIMDINIEELVMRMGKRGRMEDQRADLSLKLKNPSSSASPNNVSPTFFKEKEEEDFQSRERSTSSSGNNTGHQSRFSVGSLSGGLGSLRKIGGKGKSKEDSSNLSNSISNNQRVGAGDEIVQITSSQSSTFNSPQISPGIDQTFDDVRRSTGKKNKLEKMGISTGSASGMEAPDLDDPLFDLLASSHSRMSDQEAVMRPGSRLKTAQNGTANPRGGM